jgi:hypothetical protein
MGMDSGGGIFRARAEIWKSRIGNLEILKLGEAEQLAITDG